MILLLLWACIADKADPGEPFEEEPIDSATSAAPLTGPILFTFPADPPSLFHQTIGVDHDPTVQEPGLSALLCTDYLGRSFPHCYDEHDGSDFILDGGFDQMDAASPTVIAAAPGLVIATEDGHYDRCHGDASTGSVSCDGNDGIANSVIIEHEGGYRSLYWHLKTNSVAVAVGDRVERGTPLGQVGSSGYSSMPHLHFELQGADQQPIDPFAGPFSQPETWWCAQAGPDDIPGPCP